MAKRQNSKNNSARFVALNDTALQQVSGGDVTAGDGNPIRAITSAIPIVGDEINRRLNGLEDIIDFIGGRP